MNEHTIRFLYAFLVIIASVSCQRSGPADQPPQTFSNPVSLESTGFNAERLSRIDSLLSYYTKSGILPNAATFVARKGEIIHHETFGFKDLEKGIPLEPDDIFRLASQTKAITTAALLTLYEEGRFLLDDPVSKYIPEFDNPRVMTSFNESDTTYTARPANGQITIRHLLNHTSGIHYGIFGGAPGNMMFAKEDIPAVNSMDPISIEDVVKKIASMPLMFDPGEKYLYGMNTDVAGYLIEVISGQSLDIFMKERIFDPLGMEDTYFYLPSGEEDRLVKLYSPSDNGLILHPDQTYRDYPVSGAKQFLSGGAGLSGTLEDYARFCQMLLNKGEFNGNRILSRKTIELMTTNQIGDMEYGNYGRRFGLGLDIWNEETVAQRLGSEGSLAWGGLYYTNYRIDPAEDLIILFCTNVHPWQGPNVQDIFQNLVYQALE